MPTPSDRPTRPPGPTPPVPAPTAAAPLDRAIRWVGWHLVELTGAGVPTALALTVSPWWALPAVLVGGLWVTHEIRLARGHHLALTTGSASGPASATPARGPARDEEASAS
jgi:hypothetical protein